MSNYLKEQILEYSGVLTEASKLSNVRAKIESHIRRGMVAESDLDDIIEKLSDRMKVDITTDDSLLKSGIPHFRVDLDKYSKVDDEKRFVFYEDGE